MIDRFTCTQRIARKEKLHFHAHIWYKVSRSERVSYNGITPASQADNEGSIPFTRSNQISVSRRFLTGDASKEKTGLDGRFFCAWDLGALQSLTPPAPHTSECYTSYGLHEVCNVPHGRRYRLQISVYGCGTEEAYGQHEMGGVA